MDYRFTKLKSFFGLVAYRCRTLGFNLGGSHFSDLSLYVLRIMRNPATLAPCYSLIFQYMAYGLGKQVLLQLIQTIYAASTSSHKFAVSGPIPILLVGLKVKATRRYAVTTVRFQSSI